MFGHPSEAGVYAVCAKELPNGAEHVLYIGSTKNLKKRLASNSHPYRIVYERFPCYVRFKPTDDYVKLEIKLIKKHRPILNKTYNV
jgi:excinuclease UvrABC nuclease subunit